MAGATSVSIFSIYLVFNVSFSVQFDVQSNLIHFIQEEMIKDPYNFMFTCDHLCNCFAINYNILEQFLLSIYI